MAAGEDVQSERTTLGRRLRHLRVQQGLTLDQAAKGANVHTNTWRTWEQGRNSYRPQRSPLIAAALGVPVAQLFTDANVLAEIVVSEATLKDVRNLGRSHSEAAAERIARQLEPLIYEAATRPAVDTAPGARAKRRRTRAEVLAGIKRANAARIEAAIRRESVSQADTITAQDT